MNFIRGYSYINQKINLISAPKFPPGKLILEFFPQPGTEIGKAVPIFLNVPSHTGARNFNPTVKLNMRSASYVIDDD